MLRKTGAAFYLNVDAPASSACTHSPSGLVDRKSGDTQPLQLKIDPGSKQTGIAIVRQAEATVAVVALIEIKHRGAAIRKALQQRAAFRRRHRSSIASTP